MAGTTQYFGISYPTATDYVKDGASNMQTIATGFDSAVAIPTYNNQTGTTYTFVLADAAKTVTSNNAGAVTFTIPPQSSVAWADGTTLTIRNYGAGAVTFAGGSGVTVTNTASTVAQYGSAKVVRTGSNAWTVLPDSGGASGAETVLASGSFSAATAVNLSSVLSDTYDYYRLYIQGYCTTSAQNIALRFRQNTTDVTTGYYGAGFYTSYTGGTGNYGAKNNGSEMLTGAFYNDSNNWTATVIHIFRPNATNGLIESLGYEVSSSSAVFSGYNRSGMTNFNGITFLVLGQTMTGDYLLTGIK